MDSFFSKKSNLLTTVSVISFIVSACFSITWFTSDAGGWLSMTFWLNFGMALVFETFKIGSGYLAFIESWVPVKFKVICGLLSIGLVFYSILAASGYLTNVSSVNKNKELKTSTQYKQQNEAREANKARIESIKIEKGKLDVSKSEIQSKGDEIVNSMPKNYIDRRNDQKNETKKEIAKVQEQYNKLSAEESELTAKLQIPIDTSNIKVISEKGGTTLFKKLAATLNTDETISDPYTAEGVEIAFKMFAAILFEIIAWLSGLLANIAKEHEKSSLSPTLFNPEPDKKSVPKLEYQLSHSQIQEIQGGRYQGLKFKLKTKKIPRPRLTKTYENKNTPVISFQPKLISRPRPSECTENTKVTEPDIQKYLDFVLKNQKDSKAPGRDKIVRGTGFSQEKCRMIHNILKDRGILETGDKCTMIVAEVV